MGPRPRPGDVMRYAYLWAGESEAGREDGSKDGPCAVVIEAIDADARSVLTVLPITHTAPIDPADALEIPGGTKSRLGLDDSRSWVVLTEANRFIWPGPDATPVPGRRPVTTIYGALPGTLFVELRSRFIARKARTIRRTE